MGTEPLGEVALASEEALTTTAALPTAALSDASLPLSLRLRPELSEPERAAVDEALARGASVVDATLLVARGRGVELELRTLTDDVVRQPEPEAELARLNSPDLVALPLAVSVFEREKVFSKTVEAEFQGFAPHVRAAFASTAQLNGVFTGLESYRFIRARLWEGGRRNASSLFHDILGKDDGARLLGREIQNGAHRLLVEKLQPLRDAPQGEVIPMKSIIGFQPRLIANSENLSNHVFGLAIDIDATFNPHIRSPGAIEIVLRRTGVNLGKPLLRPGGDIEDAYQKLRDVSNRLRDWLRAALPAEARLRGAFETANRGVRSAEATLRRARTEAEKRVAAAQLEQARRELGLARDELNRSPEAFDVGELAKEFGRPTLEQWESRGLFTIPIEVARGLRNQGLDWGVEWKTHKDVMHFELDPGQLLPSPGP